MRKKLAAGYIRVSTEEQTDGWSLEGQEKQIRDYAAHHGYEITHLYRDETSGHKEKRPGLDSLLIDAHNRKFSAIIVVNTSRLFRNLALARRYKDLLRNKLGIDVIFVSQPMIDPSDPSAFIMEAMNELFDEYYLHQLRFWTTLGKQTRAQKGMWNGTLPFGYITGESGYPIPHPTNAQGVQIMFEAYATGRYSDRDIADLLNREGFLTTGNWGERKFTKDTVNRMLKNVFYLGKTKYKDELYSGKHEPLIDQALFDKCQEVRSRRRNKPRALGGKKRVYLFAGLARCHLCSLTLRCMATQSKGKWRYYRHIPDVRGYECTAPNQLIRADQLEAQWSEIITQIRLPQDWRQRIEQLATDADEWATAKKERTAAEEQLRRLTHLYRDLLIEEIEFRQERERLTRKIDSLTIPDSQEMVEAAHYLENLGLLWAAATQEEQRDITRMMLKRVSVNIVAGKIVQIEPLPVFAKLLNEVCAHIDVEVVG